MGNFSTVRVHFKNFSMKKKLNTCTDMLLDPNAFQCQVLPSFSGPL